MFFKNEPIAQSQGKNLDLTQLANSLKQIKQDSSTRVDTLEALIIRLDTEIMDENEIDADNELRRKELRPLTRTLMNHLKIDRNLTTLMLQEIQVATMTGTVVISDRFRTRFNNVVKELSTIQAGLTDVAKQFIAVYPGIVEKHLQISDIN